MIRCNRSLQIALAFVLPFMGGLTGCAIPSSLPFSAVEDEAASAYQTVSVLLTQTADVTTRTKPTPTQSITPPAISTPQPTAANSAVAVTETSLTGNLQAPLCDLAAAGNPIDVSIPDDTKVHSGEIFVKTWRLVNAGSCTWSREYAVVYFSGEDMATRREDFLRGEVHPGESMDISFDMMAPLEPGSYQGNYKLRGLSGKLFGIGPEGDSPFWVRIVVIADETLTPTVPVPTLTPTVAVLTSGSVVLKASQSYDFDSAALSSGEGDDLMLRKNADTLEWISANGARVVIYGMVQPGVDDCKSADTYSEPLVLGVEREGSFFCVRTSRGLPAWVYLANVNPPGSSIDLQFGVWAVP
jgi:hypothetical protein